MKLCSIITVVVLTIAGFSTSIATAEDNLLPANCGEGYIKRISEGGWNNDRIYIRLDETVPAQHQLWNNDYVRFSDTLSASRQAAIRAVAYLALANGNKVGLVSSSPDCQRATEIIIYRKTPTS